MIVSVGINSRVARKRNGGFLRTLNNYFIFYVFWVEYFKYSNKTQKSYKTLGVIQSNYSLKNTKNYRGIQISTIPFRIYFDIDFYVEFLFD